jgi:hypothetical protein
MDWTYNPLVALFFAVEESFSDDSVVYALRIPSVHISIREEQTTHPLSIQGVRTFEPSHGDTPRVHAQSAVFTVQQHPTIPLEAHSTPDASHPLADTELITRIRIKSHARMRIKHALFNYGVTRKQLFPGLDGLADWLRYMRFDAKLEQRDAAQVLNQHSQ